MATRKKATRGPKKNVSVQTESLVLVDVEPRSSKAKTSYRVNAGDISYQEATQAASAMDHLEKIGLDDFDTLMRCLTACRIGWEKSPNPLPFGLFSAADCTVVRKYLRVLKPSELVQAVLGASHIDTWAREQGLSLVRILQRADHYVGIFQLRQMRPDKARATHIFLEVFKAADRISSASSPEWEKASGQLSFMQTAEILEWARKMAAEVDRLRSSRRELPLSDSFPELATSKAMVRA